MTATPQFTQFTSRARDVLQHAAHEAARGNGSEIDTRHLLLGLVAEGGGVGSGVLRQLDIRPDDVRRELASEVRPGPDLTVRQVLPMAGPAKRCLELAIEEATLAGRPVGTGELFLALVRETEGVAGVALARLGCWRWGANSTTRTLEDLRKLVAIETLRAEDDAPADSLRKGADLAGRQRLIGRGALGGLLGGLLWSVPIGMVCALTAFTTRGQPGEQWALALQIFVWTVIIWASIATAVGAQRAREAAMSPEHRKVLQGYVFRAAIQALILSSPVVGFFVLGTWMYGPGGAISGGLMILGIWVGCAMGVGHGRGMARVAELQRQEKLNLELMMILSDATSDEPGELGAKRAALETAIVTRFGSLDESRRERIRTWNLDQVTEASRKLPRAASPDDLED